MSLSYFFPVAISILLHALLLLAVTWGWQASTKEHRVFKPNYVEAKLVQLKAKTVQKKTAKPKIKKVDLTAKKREQERKKKADDAARKKRLAKDRALKEKQRLAELERQRKLDQARKEEARKKETQQQMESDLADALAEEEEFIQAESDDAQAQSYVALIASRIEQHWSRPPSARKGMQCELQLQLVPTGQVVNVTVVKSSGNVAFDRSAEQAVKKVQRFTELQDMPPEIFERYFRQLRLVFNPKDLRL